MNPFPRATWSSGSRRILGPGYLFSMYCGRDGSRFHVDWVKNLSSYVQYSNGPSPLDLYKA